MHPRSTRTPPKRLSSRRAATTVALAIALCAAAARAADDFPVATGEKSKFTSAIQPVGDEDQFGLDLFVGDRATVKVTDAGPARGLTPTLSLLDPSGADTKVPVARQGTFRPSFQFVATLDGTHVVHIVGDPGGFDGAKGNYTIQTKIKRVKPAGVTLSDPAGGVIAFRFGVTDGAQVNLSASTKKGGFDLTGLQRPSGTLEPDFLASLSLKAGGKRAKLKKFPVTGGSGLYELQGTYVAGSSVKIKVKVRRPGGKLSGRLADEEPRFDPLFHRSAVTGIEGSTFTAFGSNFDYESVDHQPTFWIGDVQVPVQSVEFVFQDVFRFPVPPGLQPGVIHPIAMRNPDGQGSRVVDGFDFVAAPQVTGIDIQTGGPGGGRNVTVSGSEFRGGTVVLFDAAVAQPLFTFDDRIVVRTPAHAPGIVNVVVRDEQGQTAQSPDDFTFLDIPFARVISIDPPFLQGIGGEVVTLTGLELDSITRLVIDRREVPTTPVSPAELTFVAPEHRGGTVRLEVESALEQVSDINVTFLGFSDETGSVVPSPRLVTDEVDGWRATRILPGELNGDAFTDLVLLRPASAFGNSVNRSRVRVLRGAADGTFSDVTDASAPAVSALDDWRAVDGVLFDKDGDNDLDLAIVTTAKLDGGDRSSLRLLENNAGVFSDVTDADFEATTDYGDHNQGRDVLAMDVEGDGDLDLVLIHTEFFTEVIITEPPGPPPPPPLPAPDPTIETFFHAGLRIYVNDGNGAFTLDEGGIPDVDEDDPTQLQGKAIAAADVDGTNGVDLLLTRDDVVEDPDNAGTFLRSAVLLRNDGAGVFTDASDALLPAASDPEYLQGDRAAFEDVDKNGSPDILVLSDTRLISPIGGNVVDDPATRFFVNDGNGVFSAPAAGTLPDKLLGDSLQSDGVAVGDLNGDGAFDMVLVAAVPPEQFGRGARVLVQVNGKFVRGSAGLPAPLSGDDGRGADVVLLDVDGDGDLDILIGRDTANESISNLRVLENPGPQ